MINTNRNNPCGVRVTNVFSSINNKKILKVPMQSNIESSLNKIAEVKDHIDFIYKSSILHHDKSLNIKQRTSELNKNTNKRRTNLRISVLKKYQANEVKAIYVNTEEIKQKANNNINSNRNKNSNNKVINDIYIGDWGLGIGDCNPQSPIPNPQDLT